MTKTIRLASLATLGAAAYVMLTLRNRGYGFAGRTVLITGGSRGLGLVIARELAREGANLCLVARDPAELERAVRELTALGAEVLAIPCDVTQAAPLRAAVARTVGRFGQLDVLINNAGVIQAGPLEHMTEQDFEDALAVHFWAPLRATLAALTYLRERRGRVVNISSIGGKVAVPHLLPYTASKFALTGLSEGLRAELAKDGVRVTTVCPGLMRTGSHLNALFKGRHRTEFSLFALGAATPLTSIDARRAARKIVEACRRGSPELVITVQAKLAARAFALLPGLAARAASAVARLLPGPTDATGDELRTGAESASWVAPSLLTRLADRAARRNNELGATPRPRPGPGRTPSSRR